MKKGLAAVLALMMALVLAGCGAAENGVAEPEDAKSEDIMTYEAYAAAAPGSEVVVETYVQATRSRCGGRVTVYTQDEDGAYFLEGMACSEADYARLVPGTKLRVTGCKSESCGEISIIDAVFEFEEGSYIAEAEDVTALLGRDELIDRQNRRVSFRGMTVEAANDAGAASLYNWDGSGEEGDDLYFNVSVNGQTYSFTVESDLCGPETEVYRAVQALHVGDVIDMEGFLYWYEGVNPHITSVTAAE